MLRFIFGASGSGKSRNVYDEVIRRSIGESDKNFLIVVPDQFTMQTQMDIVKLHPRNGIMNIDVLSFSRLSHRIFEEVGETHEGILDDIGKSLVLRHVAENMTGELPVIGGNMHKMGYIDEVKSTISEFMQYRIEPEMLDKLLDASEKKGALKAKLSDLQKLYAEFKEYIKGSYIAQEETMEVLCRALYKSNLIKGSVIVFDGFTGFTPIQYQVIGVLLSLANEVIFTCTIGQGENPYQYDRNAEQELFLLSKKTVHDLLRLEYENEKSENPGGVPDFARWAEYRNEHSKDIFVNKSEKSRHSDNPELDFLEQNLFRYKKDKYEGKVDNICLMDADDVRSEVRMVLAAIRESIRENPGLFFRDFAIVCGNIERYAAIIQEESGRYEVPVYIDQTGAVRLNPFIEFLRSGLQIIITGFRYESVFNYLRCGMADFSRDEIDQFENYVRALGIRGQKTWEKPFTKLPENVKRRIKNNDNVAEEKQVYLNYINSLRERVVKTLEPLISIDGENVRAYSVALYGFITGADSQEKLNRMEGLFRDEGDEIRAKEYAVIYRKVLELLDQIVSLMGDEKISLKEFADILEVGFGDIEIGTIPASVDRIVVGDIERTRLKEVKNLFFMGVTDDLIPKGTGTGGILSDIERQFLIDSDTGIEMAPTPRQQMYIQRLYLYMNLTKPQEKLYLTSCHLDPAGKSIRPAYIINKIKAYFPKVETISFSEQSIEEKLPTVGSGIRFLAENVQGYARGHLDKKEEETFLALYRSISGQGDDRKLKLKNMLEAAGMHYAHHPLSEAVSELLYGSVLSNSVSRLEKYAQCAYAHFLNYGLGIGEREEYSFEYSDMGNVFHKVLENFTHRLEEEELNWTSFSKEQGTRILEESLKEVIDDYGSDILSSTSRNISAQNRMKRILQRTVDTLQYQLKKGLFMPKSIEADFHSVGEIEAINVNLTEDEKGRVLKKMKLNGRIDRIDTYEDENHVYVKVIDFKSGNNKFELCSLFYGLQLQLVMYMNIAKGMEEAKRPGKEVVPAAILYYHMQDPVLDGEKVTPDMDADAINALIRKQLRPNGVIRGERSIVDMLDREPGMESDVIPVKIKKEGDFAKSSNIMEPQDFEAVSDYVKELIRKNGKRIVEGDIGVSPYQMGSRTGCDYCSFKSVCGFDPGIPGYKKRELEQLSDSEALDKIKEYSED